jgi:hypothetical protein
VILLDNGRHIPRDGVLPGFFVRLLILHHGLALLMCFPASIRGVSRPNFGATGPVDS